MTPNKSKVEAGGLWVQSYPRLHSFRTVWAVQWYPISGKPFPHAFPPKNKGGRGKERGGRRERDKNIWRIRRPRSWFCLLNKLFYSIGQFIVPSLGPSSYRGTEKLSFISYFLNYHTKYVHHDIFIHTCNILLIVTAHPPSDCTCSSSSPPLLLLCHRYGFVELRYRCVDTYAKSFLVEFLGLFKYKITNIIC